MYSLETQLLPDCFCKLIRFFESFFTRCTRGSVRSRSALYSASSSSLSNRGKSARRHRESRRTLPLRRTGHGILAGTRGRDPCVKTLELSFCYSKNLILKCENMYTSEKRMSRLHMMDVTVLKNIPIDITQPIYSAITASLVMSALLC